MNKIVIDEDIIKIADVSNSIEIEYFKSVNFFGLNEIKLNIIKNSKLMLEINTLDNTKFNLNFNINSDVEFDLIIKTSGNNSKIQYKYEIGENSILNVNKINKVDTIKEMIIANLNGEKASIDYNFKTICDNKETYDYYIYHNAKNTISNIKNNGIANNGSIIYQVSSFVPKDIIGCIVNQNNRIINLGNNKSEIKPNLYIDCNDVEASHAALIDRFTFDEIFYLQSRGISYDDALNLLIKGFLLSDISDKTLMDYITEIFNSIWR